MIPGKNYKPESLSQWLEIATKGIAAAGKERITREIGTHYAEAVAAHVAGGETEEPESVAQARAIMALGDAAVAAKRFRCSCLTEEERVILSNMLTGTGKVPVLLSSLLAPTIILGSMFIGLYRKPSLVFDALLLLLFALPAISFIISRWYGTRSKTRLLLFIGLALDILFALAGIFFTAEAFHQPLSIFVGVAVGAMSGCLPKLRILKKGRKMLNDIGDVQGLAE